MAEILFLFLHTTTIQPSIIHYNKQSADLLAMVDQKELEKLNHFRPISNKADRVNIVIHGFNVASPKYRESWGALQNLSTVCTLCEEGKPGDPYILRCVYDLKVGPDMLNPRNTVHGGFQLTIFDNLSSFAVGGYEKYWKDYDEKTMTVAVEGAAVLAKIGLDMGVSRTLTATYIRALNLGEVATLEVEVMSETKTFVVIRGRAFDSRGRLATTFFHDKVKTPPRI